MLATSLLTIQFEDKTREVFITPFSLHNKSKKWAKVKSGNYKIETLCFYEHNRNDEYLNAMDELFYYPSGMEKLNSRTDFKTDKHIVSYGQDFSKDFLGCFKINFDEKRFSSLKNEPSRLSAQDIKALAAAFFDSETPKHQVILFAPTPASDFNFGRL